jgi:hypothetical protein
LISPRVCALQALVCSNDRVRGSLSVWNRATRSC